jgi:hypothetical protein
MELVKRLLIGCLAFLIIYLMFSFYNVTFDISVWSEKSRFLITSFVLTVWGMLVIHYNFKEN